MRKIIQIAGVLAIACLWAARLPAQTPVPSGALVAPATSESLDGQENPVRAGSVSVPGVLTLEAATEIFLRRNLALEAARLEVGVAAAERVAASLRPRPGVTLTSENLKFAGPTQFNRIYEVGVTVAQPLELGARATWRREVADRAVALAEARLANVMQRRLLDLRRSYLEAVLARENLEIARDNRASFEELVRLNTVRLREGDVAEGELIRVRLEKVKFDAGVAAASLAYEQSKVRLLELLGESDFARAAALELHSPLAFVPAALDLVMLRETALANRPELKAAEAEQALADAMVRMEESRGKGEITPFVGYKRVGLDDTLVAGVTIPLPFGNRNQGSIASAAAHRQVTATNAQIVRNRILAEVETAYLSWRTADAQVRTYEAGLLDQAQESMTITSVAYTEGVTPLINLIDAQRTRAEVRGAYLKALFEHRNSLFTLEQVTGAEIKY